MHNAIEWNHLNNFSNSVIKFLDFWLVYRKQANGEFFGQRVVARKDSGLMALLLQESCFVLWSFVTANS